MRARGARGVTLDVESVRELAESGRLSLQGRAEAAAFHPEIASLPRAYRFVVACPDATLLRRVRSALTLPNAAPSPVVQVAPGVVAVALGSAALSSWPVGMNPVALAQVRRARMEPVARLADWPAVTPSRLDALLGELRGDGARIVVLGAAASRVWAPGHRSLVPTTAWALRRHGLSLAWIEADNTLGSAEIARQSQGFLVRAHRVSAQDTLQLRPGAIVDRYARAARERNVRLLLVSLPRGLRGETDAAAALEAGAARPRDAFAQQLDWVAALQRETRENRWALAGRPTLAVGLARRVGVGARSPRKAMLARAGAGVATVGASLLILALFVPLGARATRRWAIIGLVLVALLALSPGVGAQLLALWAALVFPVVALAWSGANRRQISGRRATVMAAARVALRATALASAGGLVVAATLNSWTFQTKVADFAGTKASSMLPVALFALILLGEFWPGRNAARGWVRARRRLRIVGRRAFALRAVLISLAALLVVGLWLARSGNDSGVAVSDWEWQFRAALETIFVARPRTKEFLLCHPALVLGALAMLACRRDLAWPLLALGIIGQINVVNSWAQANNPLYVPFWRTVLSLLWGVSIGAALSWLWAPRLGFARDQNRWRGWVRVRRFALATSAATLLFVGARQWLLRRRYDALTAPASGTSWPWKNARQQTLRRGVTHWANALDDGTTLDLLEFDFRANPRLQLGLWDSDLEASRDKTKPANRFAYWENGFASQAARINKSGDLVACWNGGFFGLLNRKPRAADRSFHLSPVVVGGRAHYKGANHRWTWGAQMEDGIPRFRLQHQPQFAQLPDQFDIATGTLQALMIDEKPFDLRPYPWFGELPQKPPVPSTPREAGHIPTLDWMHTSRTSAGWNDTGKLWVLIVKEPDGEAPSRAQVSRRERGRGGWTLADEQRFWLALRAAKNVKSAVGLDGGDVAQAAWRNPGGDFTVLAPRIAIPENQPATLRLQSDAKFQNPAVRALRGGALSYFTVREE